MLRPLTESDKPLINEWMAREHPEYGMTDAFYRQSDSMNFAFDDDIGPVMYFRLQPLDADIVRMYIQFVNDNPRRTAVALAKAGPVIIDHVRKAGVRYLVFESVSEPLIRFVQRHFGFVHIADSDNYFLDLKAG